MKMLLGALGYDATYEGYTGGNWSINVAKQAIGIGLNILGLTKLRILNMMPAALFPILLCRFL